MGKRIFNIVDIFKPENVGKYYRGDDNKFYKLDCNPPNRFEYAELYRYKWNGEELEPITNLYYLGRIFDLYFEEVGEKDVCNYFNSFDSFSRCKLDD